MQRLTIFSDYICPFCFIGTQRADRLAEEFPIEVIWKGLEIHPEVPPQGIPLNRFTPDVITTLETQVRLLAKEIGLEIKMPEKLSSSHLALLGAEYAREHGRLEDYHAMVFKAYFQEMKDIGDIDTLVELWAHLDDDSLPFREALMTEKHASRLQSSIAEAHSLGINAVPAFVFPDGTVIMGAQPYHTLQSAAEKALLPLEEK